MIENINGANLHFVNFSEFPVHNQRAGVLTIYFPDILDSLATSFMVKMY
jgi:hypothetical protein